MTHRTFRLAAAWLSLVSGIALVACAHRLPGGDAPQALADALPGLREVRDDLLVSGQPAPSAWARLKARGVTAVVNLRPDAELAGRDERAEVEAAGLAYHHIPVAGADDLTAENAARLWSLVNAGEGRVLAHCASGNRAGALLALGAARAGGLSPEQALAFGKSAGLASPVLEAAVREKLAPEPHDTCAPGQAC